MRAPRAVGAQNMFEQPVDGSSQQFVNQPSWTHAIVGRPLTMSQSLIKTARTGTKLILALCLAALHSLLQFPSRMAQSMVLQ